MATWIEETVAGNGRFPAEPEAFVRSSVVTPRQPFSAHLVLEPSTRLDRWALRRIRQTVSTAPLRYVLWDGFTLNPDAGQPIATIVFKNRDALFGWVWDPDLNFGEAYMFGAVEVSGDLLGMLEAVYRALESRARPWWVHHRTN